MEPEDFERIRQIVREEIELAKAKRPKAKPQIVEGMREAWLQHWGEFTWAAKDMAALLAIQRALIARYPEHSPVANFTVILQHLPDWYKDKSLPILNSKLNDILKQLAANPRATANTVKSYYATKQ